MTHAAISFSFSANYTGRQAFHIQRREWIAFVSEPRMRWKFQHRKRAPVVSYRRNGGFQHAPGRRVSGAIVFQQDDYGSGVQPFAHAECTSTGSCGQLSHNTRGRKNHLELPPLVQRCRMERPHRIASIPMWIFEKHPNRWEIDGCPFSCHLSSSEFRSIITRPVKVWTAHTCDDRVRNIVFGLCFWRSEIHF